LWNSATWQEAHRRGPDALYGKRTIMKYINRPRFELYDLEEDPDELRNLAADSDHQELPAGLQLKLQDFQRRTGDPWLLKWDRE
jgi:N-sulfoglucosamine sulfohydrolase